MVPVAVALAGSRFRLPTVLYVGWFGPRGLASIVFALLLLEDGPPAAELLVDVVALTVGLSVVLHGATAAWAARTLRRMACDARPRPTRTCGKGRRNHRRRAGRARRHRRAPRPAGPDTIAAPRTRPGWAGRSPSMLEACQQRPRPSPTVRAGGHCCSPQRGASGDAGGDPARDRRAPAPRRRRQPADLLELSGGTFWMGSDEDRYPDDGESPARPVHVDGFRIAAHTVTNDDFARFVAATGYGTTAEREGWSFVFGGLLPDDFPPTRAVVEAPWWRQVHGATWLHPEGPASDLARPVRPPGGARVLDRRPRVLPLGRGPVAVGGRVGVRGARRSRAAPVPVGRRADPRGRAPHERVPGPVPRENTGEDGFAGTAPVDAFPPNGYGLYNATGNVWEWTADRFGPGRPGQRVTRGGSYLCHDSYCWRYRCAARSGNTPDSSAGNIGFRMAADSL